MAPTFFANQTKFRVWLEKNYDTATDLIVGFYKLASGKPSMTWPESVDQAICFGWIDGLTKRIDDESYCVRFTPRKATSIWSAVNIKKVEKLTAAGLMLPAGIAAYEKRSENRPKVYAYENEEAVLSPEFERQFRDNEKAWDFFKAQAPSYQRTMIHWIMRAKQQATRLSRLEKTIAASSDLKRVK